MTATNEKTKSMVLTALMATMVFVATYCIRIPNPATGGYSHMGDCMIFLAVLILGRGYGSAAAALGGALSDLLAGAAVWILPTLVIKYIMAFIMGTIIKDSRESRGRQIFGAVAGGLFQIAAYTGTKIALLGMGPAVASTPNICIQTAVGIVLFVILSAVLPKSILRMGAE